MRSTSLIALWLGLALGCGDASAQRAAETTADTSADDQKGDDPHADAHSDADAAADAVPRDSSTPADASGALPPVPEAVTDGLVRGVDPIFWRNMDDFVFARALPAGMQLYVAVENANHFSQAPYRAYGAELVRHPRSFFDNALGPFVDRYRDALWAIDCMNEPEAMIAGADGNRADWGVSWDEMRAYRAACADVVHAHGGGLVRASAGSGWHDWDNLDKGHYEGLGFDFLDAHVYRDDWNLPPAKSLSNLPVILGECGQKTETRDDDLQYRATESCFSQAAAGGYQAALAWYYDYVGSTNFLAAKNADGTWRPFSALFAEYDRIGAAPLRTGLNLAWLGGAYDHDFAPNPLHPSWGAAYDAVAAGAVLDDYVATGIGLMRVWAFEGQEGLPLSSVYEGFEDDLGGFAPTDRASASLALTAAAALHDGTRALELSIASDAAGWQGVERTWSADMPLNLAHASEWTLLAGQSTGAAAGVNLYFVVEAADAPGGLATYQTTAAGQLWLADGASGAQTVELSPAGFSAHWALAGAPEIGAARPSDTALEHVRAIGVRVFCPGACRGTLDVDAVHIH